MTRALGIIHMVVSGLLMLIGFGLCLAIWSFGEADDIETLGWVVMFFGLFTLAYLLPSFIGGIGLVLGKRWARGLIMIVSAILLLAFPLGTLLGGFGLWVLLTDTPDPPIPLGTQPAGSRSNAPSSSQ